MTIDPHAQQVGIGGALFLSSLYLLLKFRPWKTNGHQSKRPPLSGEMERADWESFMRENSAAAAKQVLDAVERVDKKLDAFKKDFEEFRREGK